MLKENDPFLKLLSGEKITEAECEMMRARKFKYEMVRILYLEKRNHNPNGPELTNFQFFPGNDFENTPIIDVVNELLKFDDDIESGKIVPVPMDLSDYNMKKTSNPPFTGVEKRDI